MQACIMLTGHPDIGPQPLWAEYTPEMYEEVGQPGHAGQGRQRRNQKLTFVNIVFTSSHHVIVTTTFVNSCFAPIGHEHQASIDTGQAYLTGIQDETSCPTSHDQCAEGCHQPRRTVRIRKLPSPLRCMHPSFQVDTLLSQLETRFDEMSGQIL